LQEITLLINGQRYNLSVDAFESLNYVIRERLGLIGTKRGCDTGGCGSCTVLVDGKAVYSCMMYAMQATSRKITTIEGLQKGNQLDVVQKSFMEAGGLQCGYCTSGFIMSARALLDYNPNPELTEIKDALVGNLCRCTGYTKIFDSILLAAKAQQKQEQPEKR
jgi:carbon-monoxide dehydrogenase small subunit